MDDREKLIELQKGVLIELPFPWSTVWRDIATRIADHLIANGVTVQRWIPVTERLPELGESVLVYESVRGTVSYSWRDDEEWFGVLACGKVTHWMPMPEPPKEET